MKDFKETQSDPTIHILIFLHKGSSEDAFGRASRAHGR